MRNQCLYTPMPTNRYGWRGLCEMHGAQQEGEERNATALHAQVSDSLCNATVTTTAMTATLCCSSIFLLLLRRASLSTTRLASLFIRSDMGAKQVAIFRSGGCQVRHGNGDMVEPADHCREPLTRPSGTLSLKGRGRHCAKSALRAPLFPLREKVARRSRDG